MKSRAGIWFTLAFAFASCDQPKAPVTVSADDNRVAQTQGAAQSKERQVVFLNRIREADPQHHTIDRALINEQNELGLVLDRSVEMEKIPALLSTMLTQMAKEFPQQDLTIVAYAPMNPPRKIGTAHLESRTREMSYRPE